MLDLLNKYLWILLLVTVSNACTSSDSVSNSPYHFDVYIPEELPNVTHQSEISWFENISGNGKDIGSITIYNELTGQMSGVEINSTTECFDIIWLIFIAIPIEETCISDYSYIATIPLGIGINYLTFTAIDIGGYIVVEKKYTVERVDYAPVNDNEPNDSYELAENVVAPIMISADGGSSIDYFLLTAQESREYTMVVTSDEYPTSVSVYNPVSVSVYNLSLDRVASSDENFFSGYYKNGGFVNLWLNAGEQVYVFPRIFENYILGIY